MPCWEASQQCLAGRRLSGLGTRCHYSLGAIGGMLGRLTPGGPSNPCDCPRDRRLPGGSDFGKQSRVRLRSYVPRRRATDRKLVRTQENGQVFLQQLTLLATRLTASEWCYRRLDAAISAPKRSSASIRTPQRSIRSPVVRWSTTFVRSNAADAEPIYGCSANVFVKREGRPRVVRTSDRHAGRQQPT
jgi:hypothetical protein